MNSWTLNDKIKDTKISEKELANELRNYNQYDLTQDNQYEMDDATKIQWAPFLFLNDHVNKYDQIAKQVMASDNSEIYDKLKEAFHSDENIEIIQKQLVIYVYKATKGTFLIEKQNKASLRTVMEYVYLYYGRNLPIDLKGQIREMNRKTVSLVAPSIITHCQQYMGYLKDIDRRPINELPVNPSKKGTKTLPSVSSLF
jgi:hypothetical protein